jgi:tRNA-dependent cyclodipeptide synthase
MQAKAFSLILVYNTFMNDTYHVIGMSPGNSYFKQEEVNYLVKTCVERYGRTAVLIADVPAVATYIAYGYIENRARRDKAIPQGNLLRNRVKQAIEDLGYTNEQVRIISWSEEVEPNANYQKSFEMVAYMYDTNDSFRKDIRIATQKVLVNSGKDIDDLESATTTASHYILSEFALMEWLPKVLQVDSAVFVYHVNWPVYENYIAGKYDNQIRKHMGFRLLENPHETYITQWNPEESGENTLKAGFTQYPPAFYYNQETKEKSGIFYEVLVHIAKENNLDVQWVEQTGYGVVTDALNEGRYDIWAGTLWQTPERLGKALFTISLYPIECFAWKRVGKKLSETSRIAIKENDITHSIAKIDYPTNPYVYTPQLATIEDVVRFVIENKADITFAEQSIIDHLSPEEQDKLEKVSDMPVRIFDNAFAVRNEQHHLLNMMNRGIWQMVESGKLKEVFDKYRS